MISLLKFALFDAREYDRDGFIRFSEKYNIYIKFYETKLNPDTVSLAKNYDGVIVFVNDYVCKEVIEKLVSFGVKIIALRCAGFNNVDLRSAQNRITVIHVPAYSPQTIAEHTMALLLSIVRKIHKAYIRTRSFNFSINDLTGFELKGKTIGVIGTGRIGSAFIDICKGFGMNVKCFDPYPNKNKGYNYVSVDDIFTESDVISLHCPLTEENTHLINENAIAKMKKGVILINTSRGGLIDTNALISGIRSEKIGGACLDVYEEESEVFFEDYSSVIIHDDTLLRLISMPNVIVTSHQAFLTREALDSIAETTVKSLVSFFDGKTINEVKYKGS